MKTFKSKRIFSLLLLLVFLENPARSAGFPAKVNLPEKPVYPASAFTLTVELFENPSADLILCSVPELNLPEGLQELSVSATGASTHASAKYLYTIKASKKGSFNLDSIKIKCRSKEDKEQFFDLERVTVNVVDYEIFGFQPFVILILIVVLLGILTALYFISSRKKAKKLKALEEKKKKAEYLETLNKMVEAMKLSFKKTDNAGLLEGIIKLEEKFTLLGSEANLDYLKSEQEKIRYGGSEIRQEELETLLKTFEKAALSHADQLTEKDEIKLK